MCSDGHLGTLLLRGVALRCWAALATAGDARVGRVLKLHLSLLVPPPVVCGSPRPCCFVPISEQFVWKINVSHSLTGLHNAFMLNSFKMFPNIFSNVSVL
jgi:hypothetical protein